MLVAQSSLNVLPRKSPWGLAKVAALTASQRRIGSEAIESYQQIVDLGNDDEDGYFPIHAAVCAQGAPDSRPLSVVQNALRDNPHAVNALDSMQYTPMHLAVMLDDVDVVSLLLAWGGDPNISGQDGSTPLLSAMGVPTPKCAKFLIENGANVNKQNIYGRSCLDYSISRSTVPVELTSLLLSHGASLIMGHGTTNPLHAIGYCFDDPEDTAITTQKLKLLLDAGLHVDEPNSRGASPLLTSVEWDSPGAVKALLQHGANPKFVTPDGRGLLHYAAKDARKETIGVLMTHADLHGLDLDLRSSEGMTAAEYFERRLKPPEDAKSMVAPLDEDDVVAWNRLLDIVRSVN